MSAETVTQTIQLILAPVVLLSASSIFVSGLLSHYEAINVRMRAMVRERLEILRMPSQEAILQNERLGEIDIQLPQLLGRHGLLQHALLAAYLSILILVASMCAIAFSAVSAAGWLVTLVLALFVTALITLLASVVLIAFEVRMSQRSVSFEVERSLQLTRDPLRVTPATAAGTPAVQADGAGGSTIRQSHALNVGGRP